MVLSFAGYDRLKPLGLIYFPFFGATTLFVIACATSSVAPKPLFIEDQTFFEGWMVAAHNQGICFLLTGLIFGLTFCLVSERPRRSHLVNA